MIDIHHYISCVLLSDSLQSPQKADFPFLTRLGQKPFGECASAAALFY